MENLDISKIYDCVSYYRLNSNDLLRENILKISNSKYPNYSDASIINHIKKYHLKYLDQLLEVSKDANHIYIKYFKCKSIKRIEKLGIEINSIPIIEGCSGKL